MDWQTNSHSTQSLHPCTVCILRANPCAKRCAMFRGRGSHLECSGRPVLYWASWTTYSQLNWMCLLWPVLAMLVSVSMSNGILKCIFFVFHYTASCLWTWWINITACSVNSKWEQKNKHSPRQVLSLQVFGSHGCLEKKQHYTEQQQWCPILVHLFFITKLCLVDIIVFANCKRSCQAMFSILANWTSGFCLYVVL